MAFATPSVSKCRRHSGEMNSPHSFGRGNFFCSTRRTRKPLFARWMDALEPAGPAPATITSKVCVGCGIDFTKGMNVKTGGELCSTRGAKLRILQLHICACPTTQH